MSIAPRILLLSNSTMSNQPYLEWPKKLIEEFLNPTIIKEILFIPFAGVTIDWDEYSKMVQNSLSMFHIKPIHRTKNFIESIEKSEAIMIGGGNTFHLLYKLYEFNLLDSIRKKILSPTNPIPYIGWSAGSNVAGPDIGTTNDMPIIWPKSDQSLNLIPYNINPHYNEWHPPNLKGETRSDRLNECILIKKRPIIALSEGCAILIENQQHKILAPSIDLKCFGENGDQRLVKIWFYDENEKKIKIEQQTLNCNLNDKFILKK